MKETIIDIAIRNFYTPWKFAKMVFGTLYEWADPAQTMVNFEQNKWEVMQHPSILFTRFTIEILHSIMPTGCCHY